MTINHTTSVEALPLVLVHGFLSGSDYWSPVQECFAEKRPVIAIDLPGFGKRCQDAAFARIDDFAGSVLDELDGLGIEQFVLLGHSMGGMIAQEIAYQAPKRVASMILFGTGPEGELPGRFEPIAESRRKVSECGKDETIAFIVSNWYVKGESAPWFQPSLDLARQAREQAVLSGLAAMECWSGVDYLATHAMPTLVIWGDQDRAYPLSQELALWQGIREARLAVIPDAGHNAHHEKSGLFCALIEDFLSPRHRD